MKFIATAVLSFGVASSALAGIYDITLSRVATSDQYDTCQGVAEELALAFAEQTTAKVINVGCRQVGYGSDALEVVLTYERSERLALTTTDVATIDSFAFYDNHADCVEQLEAQKELFTSGTGLRPLIAYCMMDAGRHNLWTTRVDGIGVSDMSPDVASVRFEGDLLRKSEVLLDYETAAAEIGLVVFESGTVYASFGEKIMLRLYAQEAYSIHDFDSMNFDEPAACFAAADEVREILSQADQPVVAFCSKVPYGRASTLHVTAFKKTLGYNDVFEGRSLVGDYGSLAECRSAADAIAHSTADAYGAVCAGMSGLYNVYLFHRP